jgi:putative flippase GtrA
MTDAQSAEQAPPQRPNGGRPGHTGLPLTFLSFLLVGGIAFVVTEAVLFLGYDSPLVWFLPEKDTEFGIGPVSHPNIRLFIASVLAVEVAIAFKFVAYERWTFRDRQRRAPLPVRFIQLNVASLLGAGVTVATVNVLSPLLGLSPYVATAAGVLAAFMLNWVASSHLIWPEHRLKAGRAASEQTS